MLGAWAFLIGVILAVIVGLFSTQLVGQDWILIVLVLAGLIIGFLNVSGKEVKDFLLIGTALVIVGRFGGDALFNVSYIGPILSALVILFAPATIIVALKAAFALAKN